jgi:hypothetical protein
VSVLTSRGGDRCDRVISSSVTPRPSPEVVNRPASLLSVAVRRCGPDRSMTTA